MVLVFTMLDGGTLELAIPTEAVAHAIINLGPMIQSAEARRAGNPDAMALLALDVDGADVATIDGSQKTMLTLRGQTGLTARFALPPEVVSGLVSALVSLRRH